MHAHLRIAIHFFFTRTFKTKLRCLLYIGESLFYCLTLTITTNERRVDRNKEAIFVFLDDDWKPALGITLFHWTQYTVLHSNRNGGLLKSDFNCKSNRPRRRRGRLLISLITTEALTALERWSLN